MKEIIGMVHLAALPGTPNGTKSMEEVFEQAKNDLLALEEGGIRVAIVENMFDTPYTTDVSTDTLIQMTHLFTRLRTISSIRLGINIHSSDRDQEMLVATYCGADFIRAESFVEYRVTGGGMMKPMAPLLMRTKKHLQSEVKILADIHGKHTTPLVAQPIDALIHEALSYGCDGIILTGLATGSAPTVEDAKSFKAVCGDAKLYIGSGVTAENIRGFLQYADGVIVGSSIKEDGKVERPVDVKRVQALMRAAE